MWVWHYKNRNKFHFCKILCQNFHEASTSRYCITRLPVGVLMNLPTILCPACFKSQMRLGRRKHP